MIEILRKADEIPPEELEQAKVDFELKRLELVELEEKLERAKMVAPFHGTIVSIMYDRGRSSAILSDGDGDLGSQPTSRCS